jgi:hypothetical protein
VLAHQPVEHRLLRTPREIGGRQTRHARRIARDVPLPVRAIFDTCSPSRLARAKSGPIAAGRARGVIDRYPLHGPRPSARTIGRS